MKQLFTMLFLFLSAGCHSFAQVTTSFELFEDFDDPTHYEAGGNLPDGWVSDGTSPFVRGEGSYFGLSPKSGSYVLATPGSTISSIETVVYTPIVKMAGGRPCTITFYIYAPGGSPSTVRNYGVTVKAGVGQETETQTYEVSSLEKMAYTEWTEITGTFIPETDGEYCFSITLASTMPSCGIAAIDDVMIKGEKIGDSNPASGLEPDPENEVDAIEIPYMESFDNENENYDGSTSVPAHWFSTGTTPFVTANTEELPANTGTYYLITPDSKELRDERLYTPFFVLNEGTEYVMSMYVHMNPGTLGGNTTLDITVGTQQESDFHVSMLTLENYSNSGWERKEIRFTPAKTGAYCFSFAISSEASYAGYVAFDDFMITAEGLVSKPQAAFGYNLLQNIQTGELIVYKGQTVKMVNLSQDATSYEWSIIDNDDAIISDATAAEPEITFLSSGKYTVKLTAVNSAGERSTFKEMKIEYIDSDKDNYGITVSADDDRIYSRGLLPAFDTGETDFITGPNHYYRKIAERLCFPDETEVTLYTLNLVKTNIHYKVINNSQDSQFDTTFDLMVLGETDGKPDETKVLGHYSATMREVFGTTGIGTGFGEFMSIVFDDPITVKGNCYIMFAYDDKFDIEIEDPNAGCSYVGMQAFKHSSGVTTLWAKPYAVPGTSDADTDEWCTVDRILPSLKGFGLWMTVWVTSKMGYDTGIDVSTSGDRLLDVRSINGGFIISGTEPGEKISVYRADGSIVASSVADGKNTFVPSNSAASGIYIIKTDAGVKKIIR